MKISEFDYNLPKELIAQKPLKDRSASRLMIVDRKNDKVTDSSFKNFPNFLNSGDCLVLNDTRVISARLYAKAQENKDIEILLLKPTGDNIWECLAKPAKRLKISTKIKFKNNLEATVIESKENGIRCIKFDTCCDFYNIIEEIGFIPLPPYINETLEDKERYQTIYNDKKGSVAAPTAGLHFTEEVFSLLEKKGVNIARLTLHVGIGTFRPVNTENIEDFNMHKESYSLSDIDAKKINTSKENGKKIVCVGTTSLKTLETIYKKHGKIIEDSGESDLFIYPGFKFNTCDALLTNFHLPKSTLLMLVSAFYDKDKILQAYRKAIELKYRFFSFGDAMFIY